jgi:hypothetical protein
MHVMNIFDEIISDPYFLKLDRELSKFNIFHATDMKKREIKHTKFLGYLLDPNESHQLGTRFIWHFLRRLSAAGISGLNLINLDIKYTKVNIEYNLQNTGGQRGQVDLLLEIPMGREVLIIAIENKIIAGQGNNQLQRYKNGINQIFQNTTQPQENIKFIYLTINEDPPNDGEWKNVIYADTVIPAIKDLLSESEETLSSYFQAILKDYIEIIEKDEDQTDYLFEIYKSININVKTNIRKLKTIPSMDRNSPEHKIQTLYPRAIDYIVSNYTDARMEVLNEFNSHLKNYPNLKFESSNRTYLRFTFLAEIFQKFLADGICSSPARRGLDSRINLSCEIEIRPTAEGFFTVRCKLILGPTNENFNLRREFLDIIYEKLNEIKNKSIALPPKDRTITSHYSTIATINTQQPINKTNEARLLKLINPLINELWEIIEKINPSIEESIICFTNKYRGELIKIGVPEAVMNAYAPITGHQKNTLADENFGSIETGSAYEPLTNQNIVMPVQTANSINLDTYLAPAFDAHTSLWSPSEASPHFHHLCLTHRVQIGGTCVSTGLSLLTKEEPVDVRAHLNTQDPISWSRYLQRHGMKLAYCATDLRRLRHYVNELLAHDDLFTLSTYSPSSAHDIGEEPDRNGWICGSHFVVLHRDTVYDTRFAHPVPLREYCDLDRYVKRLFRVVPASHVRGL